MRNFLLGILIIASLWLPNWTQAPTIPSLREYAYIQNNSVIAFYSPTTPNFAIYGALIGQDDIIYLLEQIREKYPELYRIIKCESNFKNICNQKYGCRAGTGLAMIIPTTGNHCEKKLGRELDLLNPQDNLDCAIYLYTKEGNYHWGTPETKWGTYYCWANRF